MEVHVRKLSLLIFFSVCRRYHRGEGLAHFLLKRPIRRHYAGIGRAWAPCLHRPSKALGRGLSFPILELALAQPRWCQPVVSILKIGQRQVLDAALVVRHGEAAPEMVAGVDVWHFLLGVNVHAAVCAFVAQFYAFERLRISKDRVAFAVKSGYPIAKDQQVLPMLSYLKRCGERVQALAPPRASPAMQHDIGCELEGNEVALELDCRVHWIVVMNVAGNELLVGRRPDTAVTGDDVVGAFDQNAQNVLPLGS